MRSVQNIHIRFVGEVQDVLLKNDLIAAGIIVLFLIRRKKYYKHRLIAIQWIPNNDLTRKDQLDHINRDRADNHISNLR